MLRLAIALAVVTGIGWRAWREREKLAAYELTLSPGWLVVSGLAYVVGLAPCAVFWRLAMCDGGARPSWTSTLAAYYAGHLGKYVPGKGLVVVLRATLVRGPGVNAVLSSLTCVHETMLMMATGAGVAAACLLVSGTPRRGLLVGAAAALAVVLGVGAIPPAARLARLALRTLPFAAEEAAPALRWQTVAAGAAMIAIGWFLMGASLAAVLAAMGERAAAVRQITLPTAAVALATVGGFVSLLPGGLGSREWILMETLGPAVGSEHALVAAVLLRLVWLAAESLAAFAFWVPETLCRARVKASGT